jgi:hypothetical protein
MEITHELKNSAISLTGNTDFVIQTNCHAMILDNNGQDDAKVYFNFDVNNFYLLKAGTSLPVRTDNENEIIRDILKIEFVTNVSPLVNVLRQNKTMIKL